MGVDVEMFGKAKKDWLSRLLELPNGIPSVLKDRHDTFGRVFARLDPVQFEECFEEWVHAVNEVTGGQVVAIDGKMIRRSHERRAVVVAIHMVRQGNGAQNLSVLHRMAVNMLKRENRLPWKSWRLDPPRPVDDALGPLPAWRPLVSLSSEIVRAVQLDLQLHELLLAQPTLVQLRSKAADRQVVGSVILKPQRHEATEGNAVSQRFLHLRI